MSSPSPPLTPPTSDSEGESNNPPDDHNHFSASSTQPQSRTLPLSTSSNHPFAASAKANRAPPSYEKKLSTPPATPPELSKKIPHAETRGLLRQDSRILPHPPSPYENEQILWESAISSAVDGAKPKIDLSGNNLTHVPPSIIDLKHLVVLPKVSRVLQIASPATARSFQRSVTAPALLPSPRISGARQFLPTMTTNAFVSVAEMQRRSPEGHSKCEIELYLMRNAIRVLPRELFGLDCLVVLSLRQNKLTSLPPAIGQLRRLRELNIASNRLAHLPAEILQLRLASLNLHPNPFTPPPPRSPDAKQKRSLGRLERVASVPTLSEFMLRYLLSPATSKSRVPTRLEASMTQPLNSLQLPGHFQRVIRASTGHDFPSGKDMDAAEDVTANVCPNPDHVRLRILGKAQISDGTFCRPAETMMEWVSVVAGVQVAESLQACVPVLWRGCSKGCLAFLEEEVVEGDVMQDSGVPAFVSGTGEDGEMFEFSDDE